MTHGAPWHLMTADSETPFEIDITLVRISRPSPMPILRFRTGCMKGSEPVSTGQAINQGAVEGAIDKGRAKRP